MEVTIISLLLDVVILGCLGGTIFYVMRLMKALESFRANRKEMQSLITDLSQHIDSAQMAINGLSEASRTSGEELQGVIDEARRLADDLRQVNEAGEGMASRLETLATDNRKAAMQPPTTGHASGGIAAAVAREEAMERESGPQQQPAVRPPTSTDKPYAEPHEADLPSFFIQDREFDGKQDMGAADGGAQSQAEKELLAALRKRGAGGV